MQCGRSDTFPQVVVLSLTLAFVSAGHAVGQATDTLGFEVSVAYENEIDTPIKAQVEQRISVSGPVTERDLRRFLETRYKTLSDRGGFTHYGYPTNIFIYIFATEGRAKRGGTGWMGALMKGKGQEPRIQIKSSVVQAYLRGPERQFGLSETRRKDIFKAIVRAEDRALNEATDRFPDDFDRQGELEEKLRKKYVSQVRKEYDVSEAIADSIRAEALAEEWPLPPPK